MIKSSFFFVPKYHNDVVMCFIVTNICFSHSGCDIFFSIPGFIFFGATQMIFFHLTVAKQKQGHEEKYFSKKKRYLVIIDYFVFNIFVCVYDDNLSVMDNVHWKYLKFFSRVKKNENL